MIVRVNLYAMLRDMLPPESDGEGLDLEVEEGTTPQQIIDQLEIPEVMAHLVMLDGFHLIPDEVKNRAIKIGEIMSIFPPIAGGSGQGAQTQTVTKEMGISHKEFFRTLPKVLDGMDYTIDGNRIVTSEANRQLEINVSDERERKLSALMSLPVTDVELIFTGYSGPDRHAFLEIFDINFFRGGG